MSHPTDPRTLRKGAAKKVAEREERPASSSAGSPSRRKQERDAEFELELDGVQCFTGMLNAMIDAVVVSNVRGRILFFNHAAEKVFQWPSADIVGLSVELIMPEKHARAHSAYMARYQRSKKPRLLGVTRELKGRRRDGVLFPLELSLGQLRPPDRLDCVYYVAVIRDLTRRKREQAMARKLRYEQDFEELALIGSGGFASVFRVRNRVDGREYAVKKVLLHATQRSLDTDSCDTQFNTAEQQAAPTRPKSASLEASLGSGTQGSSGTGSAALLSPVQRKLNEVRLLARISNHPNVVRYYNSWVESCPRERHHLFDPISEKLVPLDQALESMALASHSDENADPTGTLAQVAQLRAHHAGGNAGSGGGGGAGGGGAGERGGGGGGGGAGGGTAHNNLPKEAKLSDFVVIRRLAAGSFGKVFLVRHRYTEHVFALKIVEKKTAQAKNVLARMLTEKEIQMKMASSQFVVQLYYTFQSELNLYFVMEFLPGGDLVSLLENVGYIEERHVADYTAQMVLALEDLHSQNVIHRDFKPDNLLIDRNGRLKLTDFGLSHQGFAESVYTQSQVGTPDYLAPEVIRGHTHSYEVDWWALGVVVYELLTGVPPFNDERPVDIFRHALSRAIVWPSGEFQLSEEARDFVDRLLTLDPNERLGHHGAAEVKAHPFLHDVDWVGIQTGKSNFFVPQLEDSADAIYFPTSSRDNSHASSAFMCSESSSDSDRSGSDSESESGSELGSDCSTSECSQDGASSYSKGSSSLYKPGPTPQSSAALPGENTTSDTSKSKSKSKSKSAARRARRSRRKPTPGDEVLESFAQVNEAALGRQASRQNSSGGTTSTDEEKIDSVTVLYIQMELYQADTMRQWLDRRDRLVSLDVTCGIVAQITQGLAHIHEHHVVHRDLKPANILIDQNGHAKIGDFGLATSLFEDGTVEPAHLTGAPATGKYPPEVQARVELTTGLGTHLYAAPEQLSGDKRYTQKVDIWALGMVFAELAMPAFSCQMARHAALLALRRQQIPEPLLRGDPEQLALLRALLDPDPARRPTAVQVLEHRLIAPHVESLTPLSSSASVDSSARDSPASQQRRLLLQHERVGSFFRKPTPPMPDSSTPPMHDSSTPPMHDSSTPLPEGAQAAGAALKLYQLQIATITEANEAHLTRIAELEARVQELEDQLAKCTCGHT